MKNMCQWLRSMSMFWWSFIANSDFLIFVDKFLVVFGCVYATLAWWIVGSKWRVGRQVFWKGYYNSWLHGLTGVLSGLLYLIETRDNPPCMGLKYTQEYFVQMLNIQNKFAKVWHCLFTETLASQLLMLIVKVVLCKIMATCSWPSTKHQLLHRAKVMIVLALRLMSCCCATGRIQNVEFCSSSARWSHMHSLHERDQASKLSLAKKHKKGGSWRERMIAIGSGSGRSRLRRLELYKLLHNVVMKRHLRQSYRKTIKRHLWKCLEIKI